MLQDGLTDFITFGISVLLGIALCLIYDFFRVLRMSFSPSTAVIFIEDILYALICASLTFSLLLLRCSGKMRLYVFAGELIGFLLCRFTVSRVIVFVFSKIISAVKSLIFWIDKRFIKPLFTFIYSIICRFSNCLKIISKKVSIFAKKALQRGRELLYNVNIKKTNKKLSDK
jgi:spore cortex biosynthesis protein YabQ